MQDQRFQRQAPPQQGFPHHFDATERRRGRLKSAAAAPKQPPAAPPQRQAPPSQPLHATTNPPPPVAGQAAAARQPAAAAATSPVTAAAPPEPPPVARSAAELSAFLVNFVVEQTGYPPEIVELDADLEADLGIDSIKKAQLFGEIGEYFAIPPRADLALDDFPTLQHVLDFLIEATAPAIDRNGVASPQPATAGAPVMPSGVAAMPELAGPAGSAAVASRNGHAGTEPAATEAGTGRSVAELSAFLVNFVVEQTGYPPEIVELDADLEADLGIDSIKKAQLFGEIGEYFAIPPRADLALDDFPTLRHVLDFLVEATSR